MPTRASWLMLLLLGCGAGGTNWQRIETSVDAICGCQDLTCVDRASADWDALPWPDLRRTDRRTWDRSVGLAVRGNRCQLEHRARPDLDLFAQLAARMCACTDAACGSAVDDEAVAWLQRMEHEPVGGRILMVAHDSIVELDACHAALAGGAAAAPGVPVVRGETVAARVETTAARICACSTMICADLVDHELVEWVDTGYKTYRDPPLGMVISREAKGAYATYQRCHAEKSGKWPHRSILRNRSGIEP